MAAVGYTPIQLYRTATAAAVPVAGNLNSGELAINYNDGILYYKDNSGVVQVLARKANISGSGTTNYISKFTGSATLGSSVIYDDGTNVGIGTSGPTTKLEVANSGYVAIKANNYTDTSDASFNARNTLAEGNFGVNATGQYMYTAQAVPTLFYNSGTERMRIDASGKIGIGTSSPTAILHLKAGTATANTAPLKLTSGTNLTTAENGVIEYNGTTMFSTGNETVGRGVILAPTLVRINTTRTKANNNTTAEAIFDSGNDELSLAANTLYYFKGVYLFTTAATGAGSTALQIGFNFTTAPLDIGYRVSANTFTALSTAQYTAYLTDKAATTVTPSSASSVNYAIEIEGWFKSNATVGGTITPVFTQTVVGASSAPSALANTWLMIQPMGSVTATVIAGNWT